jgi:UDP-glucose 4-epimerase
LIKVACETATGKRPWMQVYGTDYPTPDGTCIRDYIHVSDLAAAHRLALQRLRAGGDSLIANCGYSQGYSVLEVIDSVRRVHGADFDVRLAGRRPGDAPAVIANSDLARRELGWQPKYDDLDCIVADALNWEKLLAGKNTVHGIQTPEPEKWLTLPEKRARAKS